ncbi:DUF305 domain-containing protein [Nocardia inohanensis]|uniref:DUF305 domain-containing protein n=1 Tax=Nocardia inohanensis TaxID=209246 RepID=UPI000835B091|nr:DUF305 domain-containing protein [Nocardia inohanensis]
MPPLVSGDDIHDYDPAPDADPAAPHRGQRTALLVLGVIGVLLIGVALGLFAHIPLERAGKADPNPVDIGFSQDMSVHHAQAVEMSAVALSGSTDPDVKRLAYDILTTQQNQIGRMQAWLQGWNEPFIAADGYMSWMTGTSGASHHGGATAAAHTGAMNTMPGMASQDELAALKKATGTALDVQFLQLMLRHHQGGMGMIQYAEQRADTDVVRALAASMAKTQTSEAELMTQMLAARGSAPLPMN